MAFNMGGFGSGTFGGSFTGTVTDREIMSCIQVALLEPDDGGQTWPSGMWGLLEVVGYINDRVRRFISESGITAAIQFVPGQANQSRYNLPDDCIDLRRVAWRNGPSGFDYVELARGDSWEFDHGIKDWPIATAPVPERYTDAFLPSLQIQVVPQPTDVGEMEITYTSLGVAVDGTGIPLSLPDDFAPYICYGVKADMLKKEGEANDPDRATYCESRFSEGIELARILLTGGMVASA